jgi:serine/threonine protein kinase
MSPEAVEKHPPTVGFDLWSLTLTILELFLGNRPWEYGGAVGEALDQYLEPGKAFTPVPERLYQLLKRGLDRDPLKRFQKATDISESLASIYKEIAGKDYPRPKPYADYDSADNLNNRAVSMVDLGHHDRAEQLWKLALKEEPDHLYAFFNLALHRFRQKTLSAEAFQGRLDDLVRMSADKRLPDLPLIMSGAYLELGLIQEATNALSSFDGPALNHEAKRLSDILERSKNNPEQAERMRPAIYRISRIRERSPKDVDTRKLIEPILSDARRHIGEKKYREALESLSEARRYPEAINIPEFIELWQSLYNTMSRVELLDVKETKTQASAIKGDLCILQGNLLVYADGNKLNFVKNFQTPVAIHNEAKLANQPVALTLSHSGKICAVITQEGHLWLFNPDTGSGLGQAVAHAQRATAIAFSTCDRKLFTAGDEGELKMWDTRHGYLDKGTPLLVRKLSQYPLIQINVTPNGRIVSVLGSDAEYRLNSEKLTGPIRSFPIAFRSEPPYTFLTMVMDPFSRYMVSSWREGIIFHQLFDTDWKPDLSNMEGLVTSLAISPDAKLWAAGYADERLVVGIAPKSESPSFLAMKKLSGAGRHYLHFLEDNAQLMAMGKGGLSLFSLDWDLELPQSHGWDKRADEILFNYLAKNPDLYYSDKTVFALKNELAVAGMPNIDPNLVAHHLKEAVAKSGY